MFININILAQIKRFHNIAFSLSIRVFMMVVFSQMKRCKAAEVTLSKSPFNRDLRMIIYHPALQNSINVVDFWVNYSFNGLLLEWDLKLYDLMNYFHL